MESVIKFKYKLKSDISNLLLNTVQNYMYDYIECIAPIEINNDLKHCSLYCICQHEFIESGGEIWTNPIGIVEKNDISAMIVYANYTKNNNGAVLFEVVNRCDNIKVEYIKGEVQNE